MKRPIYFASTVPSEQFNGLDNYLYYEGLAKRLMPFKPDTVGNRDDYDRSHQVNTNAMYDHMMNKFKWGNLKTAKYLDPQSRDDTFLMTGLFNTLISSLLKEGKMEEAKKVLAKYDSVLPKEFYNLNSLFSSMAMIENMYAMKEAKKGDDLAKRFTKFIHDELNYLADVSQSKGVLTEGRNVERGMYCYGQITELVRQNGNKTLGEKLQKDFMALQSRFASYMGESPR